MPEWGWAGIILVVGALGIGLWVLRLKQRAQKNSVLKAVIDIYASGDYHVEFIPGQGVHPVDMVQLVISYFSNVFYVTAPDRPELKQSLFHLIDYVMQWDELSDPQRYRDDLWDLAEELQMPPLSDGRYTAGESEKFQVRLIRGRAIDYSLTEFAMKGYVPNLSRSAQLLYCETAQRVDDTYLKLMHHAMIGISILFARNDPEMLQHQKMAFAMVEYVLRVFPEPIENSPDRMLKHGENRDQHWQIRAQ